MRDGSSQIPSENQSNISNMRRRYPKNNNGGKEEWHALILHQNDIQSEIEKIEKVLKGIKTKAFVSELDLKLIENYNEQKRKLEKKLMDAEQIRMVNQQNYDETQRFMQNKAILQENRRKSIDNEVMELKNRKKEAKAQSLEMDRHLLQIDRMKAEEESQMRFEKRKYEENEGRNNLLLQELRTNRNMMEKQRDQKEFNDLMKRNHHKEMQKDANYKNFWKNVAENQFNLYQVHKNRYFEPEVQKVQNLDEKILKDMEEAIEKREEREKNLIIKNKEEHLFYTNANKELMENQKKMKELKNETNRKIMQDIQQENNTVEEYERWLREEKIKSQNSYREDLDRQRVQRTMEVINKNRMNRNEKLLNVKDLQAFKANDNNLYSKMWPGWNPQIGNIGKKQIDDLINKFSNEDPKNSEINHDNHKKNQSFSDLQSLNIGFHNEVPKSRDLVKRNPGVFSSQNALINTPNQRISSGIPDEKNSERNLAKKDNSLNYGHNPIVNPTPFNIQNPYLKKQYLKLLGQT